MWDLEDTPLQAVPQLEGRVWWGPTLSREWKGQGCPGPGTGGKKAEPHTCTLGTLLMDSAPFGTGHVGNPNLCLGCKPGKGVVVRASCALPLPSLASVAGILYPGSSPCIILIYVCELRWFPRNLCRLPWVGVVGDTTGPGAGRHLL